MSHILFETPSGASARLRGSERAHLETMAKDYGTKRITELLTRDQIQSLIDIGAGGEGNPSWGGDYLRCSNEANWKQRAQFVLTALSRYREDNTLWHGLDPLDFILNTALEESSFNFSELNADTFRLVVRIHAQCEIYGYVEAQDRLWLAGKIREGLYGDLNGHGPSGRNGPFGPFLRENQGWYDVIRLLESDRESDSDPVIMSYSVEPGFPNWKNSTWQAPPFEYVGSGEKADLDSQGNVEEGSTLALLIEMARELFIEDQWSKISRKEQWEHGLAWLRNRNVTSLLRLCPETWDDYRFGGGVTARDVAEELENDAKRDRF